MIHRILDNDGILPYTLSVKTNDNNEVDFQFATSLNRDMEDVIIPQIINHIDSITSIEMKDDKGNVIATYYSAK